MVILVDANVFCAFANLDDVHHERAKTVLKDAFSKDYGKVVTTDYVFDETVTVAIRRTTKKQAIELGKFILQSEIFVAHIDSLAFDKAWKYFKKLDGFSFTDCSLLAFMDTFKINKLATFDKAFKNVSWVEVID